MNRRSIHPVSPRAGVLPLYALLLAVAVEAALARAPVDSASHPGFVPAAPFLKFAGDDGTVVEISIKGQLLKALTHGLAESDPEAAKLIGGLEAVNAVVIGLDRGRVDEALALVRATNDRLLREGWEPLARVRDKDAIVHVLTRSNGSGGAVHGLTVMVVSEEDGDEDGPQLVFANIAGTLDLTQIAKISEGLDLPGLDQVHVESGARSGAGRRDRDDEDDRP